MKRFHRYLVDKLDHLYGAAVLFLVVKVLDIVSTSILVNKFGTAGEQTRVTRYAMEQLGINTGLIVKNIPVFIVVIGTGYLLNRANRSSGSRLRRNLGSVFVYAICIPGIFIVINNFSQLH